MQDKAFICKRITALRMKKNISEYRMSLDLGHGDGYIRGISSGRSLPKMAEFLDICEYLNVTPQEFFDERAENPPLVRELCETVKTMSEEDLRALIRAARQMSSKK